MASGVRILFWNPEFHYCQSLINSNAVFSFRGRFIALFLVNVWYSSNCHFLYHFLLFNHYIRSSRVYTNSQWLIPDFKLELRFCETEINCYDVWLNSGPEVEAWNRPNWCILGVSLCEFFAEVDAKGIQKSPDVTASESTDIGTNGYIVICGMDELNRVEWIRKFYSLVSECGRQSWRWNLIVLGRFVWSWSSLNLLPLSFGA